MPFYTRSRQHSRSANIVSESPTAAVRGAGGGGRRPQGFIVTCCAAVSRAPRPRKAVKRVMENKLEADSTRPSVLALSDLAAQGGGSRRWIASPPFAGCVLYSTRQGTSTSTARAGDEVGLIRVRQPETSTATSVPRVRTISSPSRDMNSTASRNERAGEVSDHAGRDHSSAQRYRNGIAADRGALSGATFASRCTREHDLRDDSNIVKQSMASTRSSRHHPLDVWLGWQFTLSFNSQDFEPNCGAVHPPPVPDLSGNGFVLFVLSSAVRFPPSHPAPYNPATWTRTQ